MTLFIPSESGSDDGKDHSACDVWLLRLVPFTRYIVLGHDYSVRIATLCVLQELLSVSGGKEARPECLHESVRPSIFLLLAVKIDRE